MPPRRAPRYCSNCGTLLPGGRCYAEIVGGWAVEHEGGGAHGIHHAVFTGYVLCKLCFEAQRTPKHLRARQLLTARCGDCGERLVRYRQIAHAYTKLPAMNAAHDARYGALALCEPCWLKRMEGEQLALFDG